MILAVGWSHKRGGGLRKVVTQGGCTVHKSFKRDFLRCRTVGGHVVVYHIFGWWGKSEHSFQWTGNKAACSFFKEL